MKEEILHEAAEYPYGSIDIVPIGFCNNEWTHSLLQDNTNLYKSFTKSMECTLYLLFQPRLDNWGNERNYFLNWKRQALATLSLLYLFPQFHIWLWNWQGEKYLPQQPNIVKAQAYLSVPFTMTTGRRRNFPMVVLCKL